MTDRLSRKQRRQLMKSVKSKDTAPELVTEALLMTLGIPFVKNSRELPGKPAFFFPDIEFALFVHGCFWHGHDSCLKGQTLPASNEEFWRQKIAATKRRDRRKADKLRCQGISVFTIWECQLKRGQLPKRVVNALVQRYANGSS